MARIEAENLRKITDQMIGVLTSDGFVSAMHTLKTTPKDQRLEVGSTILTHAALVANGVPLPADFRVTSRYFEQNAPTIEATQEKGRPANAQVVDDPSLHQMLLAAGVAGAVMDGGCCCGGAASACGGCGGAALD
jgi:hypothetical protein